MVKTDEKVLKKAQSAYFIFAQDVRQQTIEENNFEKGQLGQIARASAAKWKEMSDAEKAPYEEKATADKARFESEKASGLTAAPRKSKKAKADAKKGKKPKKEKDPNAPKKPATAYFLFLAANRAKIIEDNNLAGQRASEVTKKAGVIWSAMTPAEKVPLEAKAAELKIEYLAAVEAYKASINGPVEDDAEEETEEAAEE